MRVLVTGGCGFIGSHVCEFYRELGWDVISYDNMTKYELSKTGYNIDLVRMHNWNYLENLGVRMVKKDIRDLEDLTAEARSCDFIVHTAAQPAMTLSMEEPHLDLTTNVLGTFNVLETARQMKIPVVSCSSIHVYGTGINDSLREGKTRYMREPVGIDENHPLMTGSITPLHASKMSAEHYVRTFIDTYGVKAATFRLTGLYGTRQFGGEDHGWVANFTIKAAIGQPVTVFNTGKQLRDILFAPDVCQAFHAFYENPVPGTYNIGGGEKTMISLLECIDYLGELAEKSLDIHFGGERFGDLYYFVCDSSKARKILGWEAQTEPREGIKVLYEWAVENRRVFGA
ncbi:MAG: NAD-dependent epimerase/dehydratase family protein [bacterium]